MATTATAPSTAANGAASAAVAASVPGARPQLKNTITGGPNGGNANRRSTQSPIDGAQRRNTTQKPWHTNTHQKQYNSSTNPITSSSPTPSQATVMKTRSPAVPPGGESDTQDKHMHDRTLYLLGNFVARTTTITLKTGARYTGILVGADTKTHDIGVAMKWVRLVRVPIGDSGDEKMEVGEYVGGGPEKTMIFEPKDLVDIFAEKVVLGEAEGPANYQNGIGTASGFRTDADISGNLSLRERELHPWQPGEPTNNLALDEATPGQQGQGWNQFEANERLFGVKSDFNEDIYTTKLDRAHPLYQQREAAAAKIAREIEGQSVNANMNPHLAEERNITFGDDSGIDEEDRYGAVQRAPMPGNLAQIQINHSRYTPPALRAPTGYPTVPGAPHDPAIIASQLVRPETLQQKQQAPQAPRVIPPQINLPQQAVKSEDTPSKLKEKPPLPEMIAPKRAPIPVSSDPPPIQVSEAPRLPEEVTRDFKQFVSAERERYKRKRADIVQRDRATKLEELKKFSLNFTLKTEVPQDLVPILAKDKQKQAEIVERAKANVAKVTSPSLGPSSQAAKPPTREPPPDSFAAKNPVEFHNIKQQLLSGFPTRPQPQRTQQQSTTLSVRLNQIADAKSRGQQIPARSPVPIPELPQTVPTGPAATQIPMASKSISPAPTGPRMNAKALEFKPNPNATTFTPTLGGPSTTATPSPTASAPIQPTPRVPSPSVFFRRGKPRPEQERKSIKNAFNPIKRMKATHKSAPVQTEGPPKKLIQGNSNDFIDPSFVTFPTWPTTEENKEKRYVQLFFSTPSTMHSPQPPHIVPHQPQHQVPPHMPHINQPPHVPHQPHHPHMPQHHLGIPPPHYEQDHLRQIPPSVMPSPSLHNATIAPYQSPVTHHSQIGGPIYAAHPQGGVGQYVPGGPGGPQFVQSFYGGGFRGATGTGQMMVQGPHPIPYATGQFMPHPQMYSPQQLHAYPHNGPPPPPPPSSQGYPSPGRGAPMMMHQGSSQGTPAGPQMVPYAIQPGQGIYAGQGQQQMGMMRGQPPPPHQGGPPPQYYHPPQGHYPPGNRGNVYGGHPQAQHPGQHAPPPQPQAPVQQTTADGEDGK